MTNAPDDGLRNVERRTPAGRPTSAWIAADALIIGGLPVVWGSFSMWGACSKEPCEGDGGLMHIFERSGVDVGLGVVTAMLGVLLVGLGMYAVLNQGRVVLPGLAVAAAVAVLVAINIHLVRIYVVEDDDGFFGPPYIGLYITAFGALIALATSVRQRRPLRRVAGRSTDAASRAS